jgi:spermidine synthase
MYRVQGTLITVSLLYLISYSLYRLGFITVAHHRKIWNSILAVSFLFTALAGIFMALQINLKWNIPFVKTLLKWHVEIGVLLGLSGIFHLIWHLSYFGKIFSKSEYPPSQISFVPDNPLVLKTSLFMTGFSSTAVQLILIREIMNISGGYELVAGIFLGSWLIASSLGAAAGGKSSLGNLRRIFLLFAISPLLSVALMILLKRIFLSTGETPSILESIIMTFLILLPFCLVSGFTFVKLISFSRKLDNTDPGKSFSIETIGGILAGILISFVTQGRFNNYRLLLIIILITLVYAIRTFFITTRKTRIIVNVLFTLLFAAVVIFDPDLIFRKLLLQGIRVTETKDTHYGNITKGVYGGEESVYYNHRLIAYSDDAIEREEDIHYALLQRKNQKSVILISGTLKSHLAEIKKYGIKRVIFLERDPELVKSAIKGIQNNPAGVIIENRDAFRYFRGKGEPVDAVILLLPPPSTLSLNRYYTTEFFKEIKGRLKQGGVFICSPGPGENYLNKESTDLYSSVYNSLANVFRYIKPVVGNKLYFIASDEQLYLSFCRLTEERGIINSYVSSDYLSDDLILKKSDEVISSLNKVTRQNRTAFPIACFYYQSYSFTKDLGEKIPVIVLMTLAFAGPVAAIKKRNIIMYFSASALAGFEIIVLLTLQLAAGNMYQLTGLVIAALMGGLAAGTGTGINLPGKSSTRTGALIVIIYYVIFALFYDSILSIRSTSVATMLIVLSTLIPAFMTGNIFRELTVSERQESVPAGVYSSDLAGSAFGFILISIVMVPALGIKVSVFFLAVLILAGILFGTNNNK